MATAEEKLDVLAAQMKSMLQLMETFDRWRLDIDNFATGLNKDLEELTSRVKALEAHPNPTPSPALKRDEEGQVVVDHGVQPPP